MEVKVLKKQNNSEECIVCGLQNDASLKVRFYECEGDVICAVFHNEDFHQSFPGRMHGGMISAVLDETIGRAVMIKNPDQWGVTGELKVRYLKPTPLETDLYCWGKIVKENSRLFKGVGYLETPDGEVEGHFSHLFRTETVDVPRKLVAVRILCGFRLVNRPRVLMHIGDFRHIIPADKRVQR